MSNAQHQVGLESLDIVPGVVEDVETSVEFYTETLGFEDRIDETFEMDGHEGRWITVGLPGNKVELSIMAADEPYNDDETNARLKSKLGSITWYTFATEDCKTSTTALEAVGVEITQDPVDYPWGVKATFADPSPLVSAFITSISTWVRRTGRSQFIPWRSVTLPSCPAPTPMIARPSETR